MNEILNTPSAVNRKCNSLQIDRIQSSTLVNDRGVYFYLEGLEKP